MITRTHGPRSLVVSWLAGTLLIMGCSSEDSPPLAPPMDDPGDEEESAEAITVPESWRGIWVIERPLDPNRGLSAVTATVLLPGTPVRTLLGRLAEWIGEDAALVSSEPVLCAGSWDSLRVSVSAQELGASSASACELARVTTVVLTREGDVIDGWLAISHIETGNLARGCGSGATRLVRIRGERIEGDIHVPDDLVREAPAGWEGLWRAEFTGGEECRAALASPALETAGERASPPLPRGSNALPICAGDDVAEALGFADDAADFDEIHGGASDALIDLVLVDQLSESSVQILHPRMFDDGTGVVFVRDLRLVSADQEPTCSFQRFEMTLVDPDCTATEEE